MPVLSAPPARNAARPWATAIFPRPGLAQASEAEAQRLRRLRPGLLGVFRALPSRPREASGLQLHKQRGAAALAPQRRGLALPGTSVTIHLRRRSSNLRLRPSSCYANVCLPSLDEQCSEKTGGQLPAADRWDFRFPALLCPACLLISKGLNAVPAQASVDGLARRCLRTSLHSFSDDKV